MNALLAGPNDTELGARPAMFTAIPAGTRLLGLRIEGGIATVNLSREFESGGGSASVLGRLAQVVYTLTQFPTVQGVRFELDGEPVEVFSGEGVVLSEPVGRDDYYDQLPTIFVNRPAWGGVLANPATIGGFANTFEATFQVRLLDGAGRTLAQGPVTATCGTGCWGTFEVSVPYTVPTGRLGPPPGVRVFRGRRVRGEPHRVPGLAHALDQGNPLLLEMAPARAGAIPIHIEGW